MYTGSFMGQSLKHIEALESMTLPCIAISELAQVD